MSQGWCHCTCIVKKFSHTQVFYLWRSTCTFSYPALEFNLLELYPVLPQVGGIRFLYDNIVESLTRFNSSPGFGCILAHSMGLGKTLQVIGFIEVFFRCTTAKHVLCVVPVNTLQNWIGEFEHWIPPPPSSSAQPNPNRSSTSAALLTNQNPLWSQMTTLATNTTPLVTLTSSKVGSQSRTDEIHYRTFNISILSEANRTMDSRLKVCQEWQLFSIVHGVHVLWFVEIVVCSLVPGLSCVFRICRKAQERPGYQVK